MIRIQELRVGNFVSIDADLFFEIKKGSDIDQHTNQFAGISITSDILNRCGFYFHDYFKIWQKNKIPAGTGPEMELDRDYWVLDFSHRRMGVELKHLHQLQNLYYQLKGKELIVGKQPEQQQK